jgi:hypothetical protein
VPIIRRNNCIYATLGICRAVWLTVWYAGWNETSTLHTIQSSIQSDKYQVSHRYSCFSWWWAHSRPKHVEKRNKQFCTKLALFTRLYRDAQSTKVKKKQKRKIRIKKGKQREEGCCIGPSLIIWLKEISWTRRGREKERHKEWKKERKIKWSKKKSWVG